MLSFALLGLGVITDVYSLLLLGMALAQRRPRSGIPLAPLIFYGMFVAVRLNLGAPPLLGVVGALALIHVAIQTALVLTGRRLSGSSKTRLK